MKNLLILVMLSVLVSCNSSNTSQNDIEAIKAAIENETNSFYKVDRSTWDASWVQGPHAYWSYSDSTGTSFIEGWENISKNFEGYFKTQVANRNIDVAKSATDLTIDRNWQEIKIYGNGAYVRYTQKVKDNQIDRDETSQIRVMEKVDGVWRVAYVGIIAKYDE
jgi:carbonic anhydrase